MTEARFRLSRYLHRLIYVDTFVSKVVWQTITSLVVLAVIVLLARALDFMGWF